MNCSLEKIQQKLTKYNIPNEVVENFLSSYRLTELGVFPEIAFNEIPSNECFETLKLYCESVGIPNALLVYKLLQIPYSQIQATKQHLTAIDATLLEEFDHNHDLFFVKPEQVDRLKSAFENKGLVKGDYVACFSRSLALGRTAVDRLNGIFDLLDDETARRIVSNASVWYVDSDPIGLIKYMLEQRLTTQQIGDLLIEDPSLIMQFRQEGCRSLRFGHNQEYVDLVITKCRATSPKADS